LAAITVAQAEGFYDDFCQMPIDYLDSIAIRPKTWASPNSSPWQLSMMLLFGQLPS